MNQRFLFFLKVYLQHFTYLDMVIAPSSLKQRVLRVVRVDEMEVNISEFFIMTSHHFNENAKTGILWPSAADPFEMAVTNEIQTLFQGMLDIQFKSGVHLSASQLDVDLLKTEKSFEAIIGSERNTEEVINENVACVSGAELVYAIAAASQPLATFVENTIVDSIECLCKNSSDNYQSTLSDEKGT